LVALENDEHNESDYSQEIAGKIDYQVRYIVDHCHDKAQKIIQENRTAIDNLVDILIDQETIEGEQFRQLLEKFEISFQQPLGFSVKWL
ncbi:MAG: cell division protein FtsH, partial [cyanobacterium endosymbiont of Rhopalodia yunnanensis]